MTPSSPKCSYRQPAAVDRRPRSCERAIEQLLRGKPDMHTRGWSLLFLPLLPVIVSVALYASGFQLPFGRSPLRIHPQRHAAGHAFGRDCRFVSLTNVRVLIHIRDRVTALSRIDRADIGG